MGAIGYFPTYTLGNLNAAQLMQCAARENPAMETELRRSEYGPLRSWLREKIHRQGSRRPPATLIHWATGEMPASRYQIDYLRRKFVSQLPSWAVS